MISANVGYHPQCYNRFRSLHWKSKLNNINSEKNADKKKDLWTDFAQLIEIHIIIRKEAYTLSHLAELYNDLNNLSGVHSCLRTTDLREKIEETFTDQVGFSKIEGSKSDFVHSVTTLPQTCEDDVSNSAMSRSVVLRKAAKIVHDSILDSCMNGHPYLKDIGIES